MTTLIKKESLLKPLRLRCPAGLRLRTLCLWIGVLDGVGVFLNSVSSYDPEPWTASIVQLGPPRGLAGWLECPLGAGPWPVSIAEERGLDEWEWWHSVPQDRGAHQGTANSSVSPENLLILGKRGLSFRDTMHLSQFFAPRGWLYPHPLQKIFPVSDFSPSSPHFPVGW